MNLIKTRKPKYMFQEIQDEMNRMMQNIYEDLPLVDISRGTLENVWKPAIEINDIDGKFEIRAELPGMSKDNIELEVGNDSVTIKAEMEEKKEERKGHMCRSEFRYGKFLRNIPLPTEIDNSNASAEYNDGILTITLPKSADERKNLKRITVQ